MKRIILLLAGFGIIAGTWWFLGVLEGGFRRSRLPEGWDHIDPPGEVCALLRDPLEPNRLWTGGKDGLMIIDTKKRCTVPPPPDHPGSGRVWAFAEDDSGGILVGSERGLFRFDVSAGAWNGAGENAPDGPVHCLLRSDTGYLYAGGPDGLFRCNHSCWKRVDIPPELRLPSIDVLLEESSGRLWVGSSAAPDGGLLSFESGRWRRHRVGQELVHPSVNMIIKDRLGRLWLATGFADRGGVTCLDGGRWMRSPLVDELAGKKVRSIFEDSFGRLWFGSEYDGLAIVDRQGNWTRIRPGDGLGGSEVKTILEEKPGVYWLGTDRGLSRIVLPGAA